jgi:hypothetical protein
MFLFVTNETSLQLLFPHKEFSLICENLIKNLIFQSNPIFKFQNSIVWFQRN